MKFLLSLEKKCLGFVYFKENILYIKYLYGLCYCEFINKVKVFYCDR